MKSEKVKKILHHCITITGFSFFPLVSRFLRKMLFVGVCQLATANSSPKGFSLERRNLVP